MIFFPNLKHIDKQEEMKITSNPTIQRPQAPLSMGFSRQEYWSGLPFPLPDPMIDIPYVSCKGRHILYH